jgi:hypothetical protein
MVGQISDPSLNTPLGIATDVSGNLYVANQGAPTVPVFAPPYTKGPIRVLRTPGYDPQEVAVSSDGLVAVANACSYSNQKCQTLYVASFIAKGATKPCATIPIPEIVVTGISFDHAGDAFVVGQVQDEQLFYVAEIKGGCAAKKAEQLTTNNNLGYVTDVHVNKQNEVALLAGPEAANVYTYKLPVNGSLGNPVSTTATPGAFYSFAFVSSGLDLYATIYTLNSQSIAKFTYPGGTIDQSFNTPEGHVAVWPPVVP